ncbi:hypothetical protein GZ78_01805 [Endozoicomonas numazuensis]|uniref:Uncharacterized protein n=1 Tax=Endozoicomonas numazuensis TaxID=1137799 RepID=A0A081NK62_9GAMM|nr:hypothetical protein GZ78_01805 [Endozoicomonas numazuensis]
MLTISLIKTARKNRQNPLWFCLQAVVYLWVIQYSVSHTHDVHKDFSAKASSFFSELSLNDHAEHWHSDQHHSAACQLTSQAPPSLNFFASEHAFCSPYNGVQHIRSSTSETPTKRLTRAPPAFV